MWSFDPTISSAVRASSAPAPARQPSPQGPLANDLLERIDRYWRAANYLTIGQIYLQANPLLRQSLRPEQIKPTRPVQALA